MTRKVACFIASVLIVPRKNPVEFNVIGSLFVQWHLAYTVLQLKACVNTTTLEFLKLSTLDIWLVRLHLDIFT